LIIKKININNEEEKISDEELARIEEHYKKIHGDDSKFEGINWRRLATWIVFFISMTGLGLIMSDYEVHTSGAYQSSVGLACIDPRVQELLGTPIKSSWFVNIVRNGALIQLKFNINGPKGSGLLISHIRLLSKTVSKVEKLEVIINNTIIVITVPD